MNVSIIQTNLHWEDPTANLLMFDKQLAELPKTDLIVLPEMFTTGFSMQAAKLAEPMHGPTMQWMQQQAAAHQAAITGSLIIKENGNFYNRLIWMRADGTFEQYDKRHLFGMANEHETYTAGQQRLVVEHKGFKICPLICYDLRFPVWNRNRNEYDLAVYVASWPQKRIYHWKSLLLARAIENQCYVVAVNRIGEDGNKYPHSGASSIIDPAGEIIFQKEGEETTFTTFLDIKHLHSVRKKLPFLKDQKP